MKTNPSNPEACTICCTSINLFQQFLDYTFIIAAFKMIISGLPSPLNYIRKYNYHMLLSQKFGMISDRSLGGVRGYAAAFHV